MGDGEVEALPEKPLIVEAQRGVALRHLFRFRQTILRAVRGGHGPEEGDAAGPAVEGRLQVVRAVSLRPASP